MIKVLLVDDSTLTLAVLQKILSRAVDIQVVGTANHGQQALHMLPELKPDVICTDLNMPIMDGLTFTQAVMEQYPRPILVVSAEVQIDHKATVFNVLQAGAIDVIPKPRYDLSDESEINAQELIHKIRVLSGVHVIGHQKRVQPIKPVSLNTDNLEKSIQAKIIGIGASTGGPQALHSILTALPANFPVPIVCVQHISAGFSQGLVNWLDRDCKLKVQFATTDTEPKPGHVYFAVDDKQLSFNAEQHFLSTNAPSFGGHRPSISVTFQSLALRFGQHAVGVLLTGMGLDGADGLSAIRQAGGVTIAQDEASSVVFGMPKAAVDLQAAKVVLPLNQIAEALLKITRLI